MRSIPLLALSLLAGGCDNATCGGGDFDCVMTHLSLTVNGQPLPLERVPEKSAPPSQMVPSGGGGEDSFALQITPISAPNWADPVEIMQAGVASDGPGSGSGMAPSITNQPGDITLSDMRKEQTLEIEFNDPNGATPGFCFTPCDRSNGRCYPHYFYCTHPLRDLRLKGVAPIRIKMNAVVQTPFVFGKTTTVEPSPIKPTEITATPIAGTPVVSWFTPPLAPVQNNNGGPGADYTQCQNVPISCASDSQQICTIQACASSTGCAGYKTSTGGWFPCSCSNCTNAAMATISACCKKIR